MFEKEEEEMKDLCDEAWDALYGSEYGMSDACPCGKEC